jgi:hypothetical protein
MDQFGDPISLCTEDLNRMFLDATEFLNPVIEDATKQTRNPYRDLISMGAFTVGEGLVKDQKRFHGGMGDLAGLTTWEQVQKGRAAGTNGQDDPGFDPCKYNAYMVRYGFDTVGYTIYQTARRTQDICINDIKWNWQFSQQIALIFGHLAEITLNIKENFNQEMYLNFCTKVVWTEQADGVEFTYNPMTSTELTVPVGTNISTLSARHFRYWYEMMALDAGAGALAVSGDQPVFPFIIHPGDFDDMLENDSTIRDDFRYADPQALIANYGSIKQWRGTGFMTHRTAPRFRIKEIADGNLVFERVLPYIEVNADLQGTKWVKNPEYVRAEYAIGVYFMKDVFTHLVPPAGPASPGGGTSFGTAPGWGGDWKWLVFPDRCENPLGEKGFYFSRFQSAAKPGKYYDKPVAVFYKRCPGVCLKVCTPCVAAHTTAAAVLIVAGSVSAVNPEAEATYTRVNVELASTLLKNVPEAVLVTFVDDTTATAYISKDANAPVYELTFATADDWVAKGGGIKSVSDV